MRKRIFLSLVFLFGLFCTPAIAQQTFYSSDRDGNLHKVDLDGNIIWGTSIDNVLIDNSNLESDTDGDLGYLHGQDGGDLKKIDKSTGDTIWNNEFPFKYPRVLEVSDTGNYYISSYARTVKVDKDSGDMVWAKEPYSTALAFGPRGYLFSGTDGDTLRKLNPSNGNVLKKKQLKFTPFNMIVNDYGYIYIGSESNDLYKYNSEFEQVWKVEDVSYKKSGLTLDRNGNVYTSNDDDVEQNRYDQFYKISSDGTIVFQKDITKGGYFRSLDSFSGDTIITSNSNKYNGYIRTYDLDGNQLMEHEMLKGKTEVVANDGSASFKSTKDSPPIEVEFDYSPKNPVIGDTVSFTNLTEKVKDATISSYSWDFGGANTSSEKEPDYAYQDTGTITTTLTVETQSGYSETISKDINIQSGLYADFKVLNDKNLVAEPIDFQDLSGVEGTSIDSWFWDFGNGDTSTSQNPSYTYDTVGSFDVTLEITGTGGNTDTIVKTVESIRNVGFSWIPEKPRPNISTEFTENVHDTGSETVFFEWGFDHGPVKNGDIVTARFPGTDSYSVELLIENSVGEVYSDSKTITTESRKLNQNRGRSLFVGR